MNGKTFARVVLVVLLVIGAVALGVNAYNAGVTAGLAQNGSITVAPGYPVGPYVGWGWGFGHGFGFFGFLGGFLFLILLFALFRAAFGGRRHGWGGPGRGGPGDGWHDRSRPWEDRAREVHDGWHREHPDGSGGSTGGTAGPAA